MSDSCQPNEDGHQSGAWSAVSHSFRARVASAAVNTWGIIDAGQRSLWGNFVWSAIGQAILIPHHTRPSYRAALFNIAGNVHILNTSHRQFPKPASMAILRFSMLSPRLCSPEWVSWSAHTCSSLCHRILAMDVIFFCLEPFRLISQLEIEQQTLETLSTLWCVSIPFLTCYCSLSFTNVWKLWNNL